MNVKYELLSNTPIKTAVDAEATAATISWSYKMIMEEDSCSSCSMMGNELMNVLVTPNTDCKKDIVSSGTIVWNEISIPYNITIKKPTCEEKCDEKVTTELIENKVWVVPYNVYCNHETQDIKLHYEFYEITKCDEKIVKKERKKKEIPITIECGCDGESKIVSGTKTTDEGFTLSYKANCIVNFKYNCCNDFNFIDKKDCNCNKFDFIV